MSRLSQISYLDAVSRLQSNDVIISGDACKISLMIFNTQYDR